MPDGQLIKKAGRVFFLLVCLFLCTACGKKKTVFVAGEPVKAVEAAPEEVKDEQISDLDQPLTESFEDTKVLVNINTAELTELTTLPGIGQTRAEAIIEYRSNVGKFEKIEDLMNVKGIKEGVFSKISSLICVK